MIEMIIYWLTGCVACIGNGIHEIAEKELEYKVAAFLLGFAMTFVSGFWTLGQMYPIRSFGRFGWLCFWILLEFSIFINILNAIDNKLMTFLVRKCEASSRVYAERISERAQARMARQTVSEYRKAKAEWEEAQRQKAEWERAQRQKAEREKARRQKAEREKVQRERAEQEKAQRQKADQERAQRQKVEWEKAQRQKAEQEKARREKAEREKAEQNSPVQKARQLLRLRETYTMSELKKARNALIKEFHPDNKAGGDEELSKKINAAYELLSKYAKAA